VGEDQRTVTQVRIFWGLLTGLSFLNDKGKQLEAGNIPVAEKVSEAIAFIQENIKWNKQNSLTASYEFRENFKKNHTGNSADVNLSLIALLRKAGINAYPIVLSTRDNGMLNPGFPSVSRLNYVAVLINHDNVQMLADATSPFSAPGILPEQCLNFSAWVVLRDGGMWVDLSSGKADVVKQFIRITVDDAKQFTADVTSSYEDYGFLNWAPKYMEAGSEELYAAQVKNDTRSVEVTSYKLKSMDKGKMRASETTTANISNTDYVQDIGREVMINPFVLSGLENPFKSEGRKFPIDFKYRKNRSIVVSITLPNTYKVRTVPESFSVSLPDNSAKFSFLCNTMNNNVNIKCDVVINKQVFSESEYVMLKSFFAEVIRKMSEPIHIDKNT